MSQGSNCSLSAIPNLFDEGVLGDDVYGHDSHSDWTADTGGVGGVTSIFLKF